MKFIDAHHHIWIPETSNPDLGYHWLRDIGAMKPFGDPTPIQRNYEFDEFSSESAHHELLGSVYVQVDGAIDDPIAETAWVDSVFEKTGLMHGIVALVDLSADDAPRQLEAQATFARVKGVRQIIARLDDTPALCFASQHWLRDARWRANFAALADVDFSFDLQLYPEQMSEAADFLVRHPDVPVIIDHAGSVHDNSEAGLEVWNSGVRLLSELPQVSIKLSGFGMYDRNWSSTSIKLQLEHLWDCFGVQRLMFGSNYPVDRLMKPFDAVVESIRDAVLDGAGQVRERGGAGHPLSGDSTDDDRLLSLIFGENARRHYRLG